LYSSDLRISPKRHPYYITYEMCDSDEEEDDMDSDYGMSAY